MADLYKYNTAVHLYKPLVKRGVVDFAVSADWTPAAGDVKISKDGGVAANVTNLPSAIAMGNTAMWDFSLTATELSAAKVRITVSDSATKAVEDSIFEIDTYGNASAQHLADLSVAAMGALQPATAGRTLVVDAAGLADANAVKVGPTGSGTAQTARDIGASVLLSSGTGTGQLSITSGRVKSDQAAMGGYVLPTSTAQAGAANTITLVSGTTALSCEPGDVILITGGTGAGQSAYVQSFTGGGGSTPIATMVQNWLSANPDATSTYIILKVGGMVPSQPSDVWAQTTRTLTGANNITANDIKIPIISGRVDANVGGVNGSTGLSGSGTTNNPWGPSP